MRASVHFTDVHKEAWPARFGPTRRCTFSVNHTGAAEPIMSHRGWAKPRCQNWDMSEWHFATEPTMPQEFVAANSD